jgi:geranylgeranyl diphosphate synthase, type II
MASNTTASFLDQLAHYRERTLQALLQGVPNNQSQPYLYGIIRETLAHAGKGFRPALCLATCGAFGGRIEDALNSAAALEMLHNAFLVHDDVEDYSEYRHGHPTIHARYGMPLAVNTGDAMQALSMRLLRENTGILGPEVSWYVFEEFDHLLLRSLEGQALELGWVRDNECSLTSADYIRMVLRKTCWYSFIHPCRLGALIARRDRKNLDLFNEFGYYLGTAFQIQDDALNLMGTRKYGKETAGDLYEGKRTLMLLHLLENTGRFENQKLRETLAKPRENRLPREIAWIGELMQQRGSVEYARTVAREFLGAAQRAFETAYSSAQENEHKNFLRGLMTYVLTRDW